MRGLDDRKQFLFVNNTKPILADKIRYYEEPFFKARAGDYFHGVPATYVQEPGKADLPGPAHIDWKGVRAVTAAPPTFRGVTAPTTAPSDPPIAIDPRSYLTPEPVHGLRPVDDGLA